MPYTCDWLIPNRVVLMRFEGEISTADVIEAYHTLRPYCAQVSDGQFHICIDVQGVNAYTQEIVRLRNKIRLGELDKYGWITIIGHNPVAIYSITTLCHMLHLHFRVFSIAEAAMDFLVQQDATLKTYTS
ncbi:MAG: hypothetical protein D6712_10030 [Chloroflexi bacterium]|nr:MAG: hypothetical protein D6712_10030 [Chloroflexota bacterium]